jgi:DNA-binding phage protein
MPKILTDEDVLRLLQHEVDKAGSQSDWANKTGVHRTLVNKALRERLTPSKSIIDALNLENVYRFKKKTPTKKRRRRK